MIFVHIPVNYKHWDKLKCRLICTGIKRAALAQRSFEPEQISHSDVLQQTFPKFISGMSNSNIKCKCTDLRIPVFFRNPVKAGKHDGKYNI